MVVKCGLKRPKSPVQAYLSNPDFSPFLQLYDKCDLLFCEENMEIIVFLASNLTVSLNMTLSLVFPLISLSKTRCVSRASAMMVVNEHEVETRS